MAFQNPIGWRGIRCGGEVLIFVSEDIPSKELKSLTTAAKDNENIFVKINIFKKKWLSYRSSHRRCSI